MAKLSIEKDNLVAIGDALRNHFGDYKSEGITDLKTEVPLVLKTNNFDGFSGNNGEKNIPDWGNTEVITIHGAATIKMAITYSTSVRYSGDEPVPEYIWVAEGAHKKHDKNVRGHYLSYDLQEAKDNGFYRCKRCGSRNLKDEYSAVGTYLRTVCLDCGAEWEPGVSGSSDSGLEDFFEWIVPEYIYEEYIFNGDTITFYTWFTEESYRSGYYCEIYAFDKNGNALDMYEMTTGKIPNTYSPEEMVTAIAKLNNFPNGEEEKF